MPSAREWAYRLEAACDRFDAAPNSATSALFLELTEKIINEAIAFELRWLSEYLDKRAENLRGEGGDGGDGNDPPTTTAVRRG